MQSVSLLCDRAVVLSCGRVIMADSAESAIREYGRQAVAHEPDQTASHRRSGSGEYRFSAAASDKSSYAPDETKVLGFEIEQARGVLGRFYPSALLFDERGNELAQFDGRLVDCWFADAQRIRGSLTLRHPWLKPGRYRMDLYLCTGAGIVDVLESAVTFEVDSAFPYPSSASANSVARGVVFPDFDWSRESEGDHASSGHLSELASNK